MIKMKWKRYFVWISLICFFLACFSLYFPAVASNEVTSSDSGEGLLYVVPVKQTIESGLEQYMRRAFSEAEQMGASYIILEINTLGGAIDAAMSIGDLIVNSPIPTVAYIQGRAISAGSYIALNADQIIMHERSTIGAAAVVNLSGEHIETDSKVVATWVKEMRAAAELNDRNPLYAEGMVLEDLIVEVPEINTVFDEGELVAFSAEEAVKAGYAEAIATNFADVMNYLNMSGAETVISELSFAEQVARFLTNPYVTVILFVIGLAGIGLEIFAPGFGVPGIIGISSFALYFIGNYIAGFAEVEHLLLFLVGIVLLLAEIFVPSFGVLGILGVLCLIGGIVLAAYSTENALASLGFAFVVTIVVLLFTARYFKHKGIWSKFVLKDQMTSEQGYNSATDHRSLIGKKGIAITPLRPSGTAFIDGQRIDVISAGDFIDKSQKIEVDQVEGTRVVVKKINEK